MFQETEVFGNITYLVPAGSNGTLTIHRELAWPSGCVMDCHTMARGSIPGGNSVQTELHVLCKGQ